MKPEVACMDKPAGVVGPATILIADDESHVRNLLTRVLENRGYQVLGSTDGREALSLLVDLARPVQLLITDVSMPGLSGLELIREARNLRPDLKVICLSARFKDATVVEGVHFMPKPFSLAGLVEKICALLAYSG
jgi:DNA-binding response OmpR family regulator